MKKNTKSMRLEKLLLISWYVTVASAPFGSCLLRIPLPVGGHFFLFRGAILFTSFLYLLVLFCRRENPFLELSKIERCFLLTAGCMLGYGLVSAAWAISLSIWFSKFFTMCQMFALVVLFLKLCRDPKVMRITLLLTGLTTLFCAVGGLIECFHGPFFDTPYRDASYLFFNKPLYMPIFTFYNPNGMAVYLLFTLETLYLYMAFSWEQTGPTRNKRILYILSAGMMLTLFLCCADGGRLAVLSIPILFCGLAGWLFMRHKKGLLVFVEFALCFSFIFIGENFDPNAGKQLIIDPGNTDGAIIDTDKTGEATINADKGFNGTLATAVSTVTGTTENESIKESDGLRVALLKNSTEMLLQSKGLGIGLGNAEPRMKGYTNTCGLTNIHCYIMEVLLEFGVFALVPLLILVFMILRALFKEMYMSIKAHRQEPLSNCLLLFFTILTYPLLSTANSSSWGIVAMWVYTALVLLYSGRVEGLYDKNSTDKNEPSNSGRPSPNHMRQGR